MSQIANLFTALPTNLPDELIETLLTTPAIRIERLVSLGHASPQGFWYNQEWNEWVVLLTGAARLRFEGELAIDLGPGDYVNVPAHRRHRVEWTDPNQHTVWLAIHYAP